jgi:hypothetical protein
MEQLDSEWRLVFGYRITDVRQAKRILNAIRVAMPLVKGKCNPVDLVLVEALRVYCPTFHVWLRWNADAIIGRAVPIEKSLHAEADAPIFNALRELNLSGTRQAGAIEDLVKLIRKNCVLTDRQFYEDRFASSPCLRRVVNLGTDPSMVNAWRDQPAPATRRASVRSLQATQHIETLVRDSGSWLAAMSRIPFESSRYDGNTVEDLLKLILNRSGEILREDGKGRHVRPALTVARACVGLLLKKPDLNPEDWIESSTSLTLLGELEQCITRENDLHIQIVLYDSASSNYQGPLDQLRRQYSEALQKYIRGLGGLTSWLSECPSPQLRAVLARHMGWHGSDATQRARILSQLYQCNRDGHTGAQSVIRVFFTNLEHTGKSAPINSYHQLKDFIDPQEVAKRLGPAPTPQHLSDDELTALLVSEETPERALKLFFHAHSS